MSNFSLENWVTLSIWGRRVDGFLLPFFGTGEERKERQVTTTIGWLRKSGFLVFLLFFFLLQRWVLIKNEEEVNLLSTCQRISADTQARARAHNRPNRIQSHLKVARPLHNSSVSASFALVQVFCFLAMS